jgi:glyoxylate utilization-related uncharacterized protein
MKTRDIRDLVHFGDDEARQETLTETEHLWTRVVCLQDNQGVGPMGDAASEAFLTILAGEVSAQIDGGRARMKQWESATVPAGSELTLRNASEEPSVVLLVVAPPPVATIEAARADGA